MGKARTWGVVFWDSGFGRGWAGGGGYGCFEGLDGSKQSGLSLSDGGADDGGEMHRMVAFPLLTLLATRLDCLGRVRGRPLEVFGHYHPPHPN